MPTQALQLVQELADQGLFVGELIAQLANQPVGFEKLFRERLSGL